MKVYVLTSGEYSDKQTWGVFSCLETLETGKKILGSGEWNDPEEYELDEVLKMTVGPIAGITIVCKTGEFWEGSESERDRLRMPGKCEVQCWLHPFGEWVIRVESPRSLDHARKVAVEKRQEWLRSRAINPEPFEETFDLPASDLTI